MTTGSNHHNQEAMMPVAPMQTTTTNHNHSNNHHGDERPLGLSAPEWLLYHYHVNENKRPSQMVFDSLVSDQNERIAAGIAPCPIPLAWCALAESVGLIVDLDTGRIVDGPRQHVPGVA